MNHIQTDLLRYALGNKPISHREQEILAFAERIEGRLTIYREALQKISDYDTEEKISDYRTRVARNALGLAGYEELP